jgi:hypothetical protein
MARPERFERPTPRFVVWCSIQLSYGRLPADARSGRMSSGRWHGRDAVISRSPRPWQASVAISPSQAAARRGKPCSSRWDRRVAGLATKQRRRRLRHSAAWSAPAMGGRLPWAVSVRKALRRHPPRPPPPDSDRRRGMADALGRPADLARRQQGARGGARSSARGRAGQGGRAAARRARRLFSQARRRRALAHSLAHWSSLLPCTMLPLPAGGGTFSLHCRLPSIRLSRMRISASFWNT